jgi:hypothetical protein
MSSLLSSVRFVFIGLSLLSDLLQRDAFILRTAQGDAARRDIMSTLSAPWQPVYPKVRHASLVQSYSAVPPWTRGGDVIKNISAKNLGAPRRRPLKPGHEYTLPRILAPSDDEKYEAPPAPKYYIQSEEMLKHPYAARARSKMGVRTPFTSSLSLDATERAANRWVPAKETGRKASFCWSKLECMDQVDASGNASSSVLILGREPRTSSASSSLTRSRSMGQMGSRSRSPAQTLSVTASRSGSRFEYY